MSDSGDEAVPLEERPAARAEEAADAAPPAAGPVPAAPARPVRGSSESAAVGDPAGGGSGRAAFKRTASMYDSDEDPENLQRYNFFWAWLAHSKLLLYTPMLVLYFQLQTLLSLSVWALNLRAGNLETDKVLVLLCTAAPVVSAFVRFRSAAVNQAVTLGCGLTAVLMRVIVPWLDGGSRAGVSAAGVAAFWMWFAGHLGNQSFLFNGVRRAAKRADDFVRSVILALLLNYVFRASGTTRDITWMPGYSPGAQWIFGWLVCVIGAAALLANAAVPQGASDQDERELADAEEDRRRYAGDGSLGVRSHLADCVACVEDTCVSVDSVCKCTAGPSALSAAGLARTFVLCFGVSGILLFLYVNFMSPVAMARWVWVGDNAWGDYRSVLVMLALLQFAFLVGTYLNLCYQAKALRVGRGYNKRMRRLFCCVLVPANIFFIVMFVLTTQLQHPIPRSFFAPQDEDKHGQRAALYLAVLFSPVIFVNLLLLLREVFLTAHRHPRTVAFGIGLANLFFAFLMLLLVFTIADERLPAVDTSARWRDQYTFTVLLLSLFSFLPVLFVRVNLLMTVRFKFSIRADESQVLAEAPSQAGREPGPGAVADRGDDAYPVAGAGAGGGDDGAYDPDADDDAYDPDAAYDEYERQESQRVHAIDDREDPVEVYERQASEREHQLDEVEDPVELYKRRVSAARAAGMSEVEAVDAVANDRDPMAAEVAAAAAARAAAEASPQLSPRHHRGRPPALSVIPPASHAMSSGVPVIPYIPRHVAAREAWSAAATLFVALVLLITVIVQAGDVQPANAASFDASPRLHGRARFMSYNIHLGFSRAANLNLDLMADEVRARNADVIVLTESDTASVQSGLVDSVLWLANELGYRHHYYGSQTGKGFFGIAMLSRFPLRRTRTYFVPGIEQETIVGTAEVRVPSRWPGEEATNTTTYNLVAVHLNTDVGEGGAQMELLTDFTNSEGLENVVITGDFNFDHNSTREGYPAYNLSTRYYDEAWFRAHPSNFDASGYPGWTNKEAKDRLDMFFISRNLDVHETNVERHEFCGVCAEAASGGSNGAECLACSASDHLPAWADLSDGGLRA